MVRHCSDKKRLRALFQRLRAHAPERLGVQLAGVREAADMAEECIQRCPWLAMTMPSRAYLPDDAFVVIAVNRLKTGNGCAVALALRLIAFLEKENLRQDIREEDRIIMEAAVREF